MNRIPDAALLLAFGGPTSAEDVRPFLKRVMQGRPFSEDQLEEIARHYEAVGGKSPMNELTLQQGRALEAFLKDQRLSLPVYVGFRHSPPYLHEVLERISFDNVRNVRALILAPHQSEASWNRYERAIQKATEQLGKSTPHIAFAPPFFDHPLFIEALCDRVQEAIPSHSSKGSHTLLFTAHSIPVQMAKHSPYVHQVTTSARLVSEKLNDERWKVAYQSRSGDRRVSWLSPDVCDALRSLAKEGERSVILVPVGFVCDHVEILYDLDIEAKKVAEEVNLQFIRIKTVGDHPQFIRMLAELLLS